jgi:hypothetical protein
LTEEIPYLTVASPTNHGPLKKRAHIFFALFVFVDNLAELRSMTQALKVDLNLPPLVAVQPEDLRLAHLTVIAEICKAKIASQNPVGWRSDAKPVCL